jgi:hypothetical protein
MELGALLLLLFLLVIVVLFVAWPLMGRMRIRIGSGQKISSLLAERERVLNALQELDFDQSLGKFPAEEYAAQRQDFLRKGAETLRQLEELQGVQAETAKVRSAAPVKPATTLSDDDLEDLIAKRRTAHKEKSAGFCPGCGKPVLESDSFCTSCGGALK